MDAVDDPGSEAPPPGAPAATPPAPAALPAGGRTTVAESCALCGRPLTRRGPHGECLRCLAGLFADGDGLAAAAGSPGEDREGPAAGDGPDPPRPPDAAAVPLRYGHFEVAVGRDGFPVELGAGAMGVTYRAQDTVLHCPVALKVIGPRFAKHPDTRARFLREARAAARLQHPNVARVFHYGEQGGECFYAMELVEGETLEAKVRRDGPLPPPRALDLGVQVARALVAAEAQGIVHRDLKPSNVMLTGAGDSVSELALVKVIDFGLAKAMAAGTGSLGPGDTRRGGFVGTPAFASPEQFTGAATAAEGEHIDTRTDIYSLGVTLWYVLTGKVPFVGQSLEEIYERQVRLPLPVDQLKAARVPACLLALLRSMLAADPAARPQSARELLEALHRCQGGGGRHRRRVPGRQGTRLAVGGVAGLLLLAALAVAAWREWQSAHPSDRSVAVLPFENLSPDRADDFFAAGVQDEIAAELARLADLKVVGSRSTRAYPPEDRDLARIGRELGVAHLLEGNVWRANGALRITVRLVDARGAGAPWTETYERPSRDIFAVQDEITRTVARRLQARLSPGETARLGLPPTSDLQAYDLYLRAIDRPRLAGDPTELRRLAQGRLPLLEGALARDPGFVLALCELAKAHDNLARYRAGATDEERAIDHRALAEAALEQARRLRPEAGEVHLALANHFYAVNKDPAQALLEVNLARRTLPNSGELERIAGEIARAQGRWEDALRCLERAVALEPRVDVHRFTLANTQRLLRNYDEFDRRMAEVIPLMPAGNAVPYQLFRALGPLERRANLGPLRVALAAVRPEDDPGGRATDQYRLILHLAERDADAVSRTAAACPPHPLLLTRTGYPKEWFEGLAARLRGDAAGAQAAFAAARAEVETAVLADPTNAKVLSLLAILDAGLGRRADAVREARRAAELMPWEMSSAHAPIVGCHLAAVYAWTNQPELALAELEKWVDRPAGWDLPAQPTYGDFRLNPLWDPLRGDPRFEALVQRLARGEAP